MAEDEMVGWHHRLNALSKLWEIVKDREAWYDVVHGVTKVRYDLLTEPQQDTLMEG